MILRVFKSNQPFTAIFVILLAILLWLPDVMRPISGQSDSAFLLQNLFDIINESQWMVHALNLLFIIVGALGINRIFNRNEFHSKSNHLPALFFTLSAFLFLPLNSFHPVLPALILVLPAVRYILVVFRQNRVLHEYFIAGFWIGLSTLVYLPMSGLFIPVLISVLYTRAFNWRELLLPLIAGCIPLLYWLVYMVFMSEEVIQGTEFYYSTKGSPERLDIHHEAGLVVASILFIPSFLAYLQSYGFSSNRSRNTKSVFTILSIGLVVIAGVGIYYFQSDALALLSLPLAVYYTSFFLEVKKRWVSTVLFSLFVLMVIARIFRLTSYLSELIFW